MAKADRPRIERALRSPSSDTRFILLHGPDEAGSRALAALLIPALGEDAERIDLTPSTLRQDPALLANEASSRSLFGARRYIRVDGAGDECLAAVLALMGAPPNCNLVLLLAGTLRRDSKLLKLAHAEPSALAFASYAPEGVRAHRMIAALARDAGLALKPEEAEAIALSSGSDREIAAQEVAKLALFADASPERPGPLPDGAVALLGAGSLEGDRMGLANLAINGEIGPLAAELALLRSDGIGGIAVLRPVLQRMLQIAGVRASLDGANGSGSAPLERQLPPSEREQFGRQASHWRPSRIAEAISGLSDAERAIKAAGAGDVSHAEQALLAMGRKAARER